jgi:hypothetical protein
MQEGRCCDTFLQGASHDLGFVELGSLNFRVEHDTIEKLAIVERGPLNRRAMDCDISESTIPDCHVSWFLAV